MYHWPLLKSLPVFPDYPGTFGAIRKYDVHTGVDLYCSPDQQIVAITDGTVIKVEHFTGSMATPPTPWWNNTDAVYVETNVGVMVYGEISPVVSVGDKIAAGDTVGYVNVPVLKKDKGRPMHMLHLELLDDVNANALPWTGNKPDGIQDPTNVLIAAAAYGLVDWFYGDKHARRSGLPLIKHIKDGVRILRAINASEDAILAFIVHPIFQRDEEFHIYLDNPSIADCCSKKTIALAIEYRNVANRFLSNRLTSITEEELDCVKAQCEATPDIKSMLIADKIQNYSDMRSYNRGLPNYIILEDYFLTWFELLEIDDPRREELCGLTR